jgi:hypothetical protein
LRVGFCERHDAGIDNDPSIIGVSVRFVGRDVFDGNGAADHRLDGDRLVLAIAAQIDRDLLLPILLEPFLDPALCARHRNELAVERNDLVTIADAGLRSGRALYDRDRGRPRPAQVHRLVGKRAKALRQALRRGGEQAYLGGDAVAAKRTVGNADAVGDTVHAMQFAVIRAHLRDLLAPLLGLHLVFVEVRQLADRPAAGAKR